MPDLIDLHMGRRLRRRRRLLGLTQEELATAVGVRPQQIQKYEYGANCMSGSCLWKLSCLLEVSMDYFVEGFDQGKPEDLPTESEVRESQQTQELVQAFRKLADPSRLALLDLTKEMSGESAD